MRNAKIFSINGAGTTAHPLNKKRLGPLLLTTHKNYFEMDHGFKHKG